jgi:alkylated DNA nucleotide flippase Atl1
MKIKISQEHANQIDNMVVNTKPGELLEFGQIAHAVFGNTASGGKVGEYIFENRHRLPGWWRVTNSGGHPPADDEAIILLKQEGHQIRNGIIIQ